MVTYSNTIPPYINGRFVTIAKPDRSFALYNPANPKDILASSSWNKDLVDQIIDGMHTAQKQFSLCNYDDRLKAIAKCVNFLKDNIEEIKSNMMLELGRSRIAVDEEWQLCEKLFQALPEFCSNILSTRKNHNSDEWNYAPLGSVLVATNISLPLYSMLCGLFPALAAGNAVCLKPSSHNLLSASLVANSIHQAALPAGLVQVVYGDFEVFRRLVLTHQFDTILCASSEEKLEQIRRDTASQQNIRLAFNCGGKNAAYVLESTDIASAVKKIIYGMCVDAGQRLEATSLVFISSRIFADFQNQLVAAVKEMPIACRADIGRTDTHVMGPLCNENAWERHLRFQGIAAREASETLRWGKPIDNQDSGYFVSPGVHIMSVEKLITSTYAFNAFFSPDLCLVPVDNHDAVVTALEKLNAARCLAVHTKFNEEAHEIRKASSIPSILWNAPTTYLDPLLPSTGRGRSGSSHMSGLGFLFSTVYTKSYNAVENNL